MCSGPASPEAVRRIVHVTGKKDCGPASRHPRHQSTQARRKLSGRKREAEVCKPPQPITPVARLAAVGGFSIF